MILLLLKNNNKTNPDAPRRRRRRIVRGMQRCARVGINKDMISLGVERQWR